MVWTPAVFANTYAEPVEETVRLLTPSATEQVAASQTNAPASAVYVVH